MTAHTAHRATVSSVDDVRTSYNFFLGRDPEPEAPLIERATLAPDELVACFVSAAEFKHSVVDLVLASGQFSAPKFQQPPEYSTLLAATRFIPLSLEGARRLLDARSWFAAFNVVFTDREFQTRVLTRFSIDHPDQFGMRLSDLAQRPLVEIDTVEAGDDYLKISLSHLEHAPRGYRPLVVTEVARPEGLQTIPGLIVREAANDNELDYLVQYRGENEQVSVSVYVDGQLACSDVQLLRAPDETFSELVGRVDVCGPIFISGWMNPLPHPNGAEYEVLIDGNPTGGGRVAAPNVGDVPRFLFAIPKIFKDGRTHDVQVRRRGDGKVLTAGANTLKVGIAALEAEWRGRGLVIKLRDDWGQALSPSQAKVIVTSGMDTIGEFRFASVGSSASGTVPTAIVPVSSLLPYVGRQLTVTLPALFAELTVAATAENLIGGLAGSVDGFDRSSGAVFGWCAYKGMADHPVSLEALVDNEFIGTFMADVQRIDLAGSFGKGFHGFSIPIPEKYKDGSPHIVELRDSLTGISVPKSPLTVAFESTRVRRPSVRQSLCDTISPTRSANLTCARKYPAPLVTIVILTRNGATVLDDCLASIWRHTNKDLVKIVVVDHASEDNTAEVVERWSSRLNLVYDYVRGNNSFSFANNRAIRDFADTEYVMLLNNDIVFIEDVAGRMVDYLQAHPGVGLVGCKLLEARDRQDLSRTSTHHLGIQLELSPAGAVDAFETTSSPYIADKVAELTPFSVTGACVMMRRADYHAIGGLEEAYFYGGEDVELGEAVWSDLGKSVVSLNNLTALHHRGWLRLSARGADAMTRVQQNSRILRQRIGYQMRKRYERALIDADVRWSASRAKFGFVVVESGPVARTGEFFTALELGRALADHAGVAVEFIEPCGDWYDVRGITHLVNMLHEYRVSQVRSDRADLRRIAWLRNNFEAWAATGELQNYHAVWCSSAEFCEVLREEHGIVALHVPIATNVGAMEVGQEDNRYQYPVIFNGSQSGVARSFIDAFADEQWHDVLAIFGHGWEHVPAAAPMWKGFVPYAEMTNLYASSKIVIDQAHESACKWGGTNSRVFDAIAAGCLPLTNSVASSAADFSGLVPVWSTGTELQSLIRHYLDHEDERLELVGKLRKVVTDRHQYAHRAQVVCQSLIQASESVSSVAIKIAAPNRKVAHSWGDMHLAESLGGLLRRQGLYVSIQTMDEWSLSSELFDVALVLRGLDKYEPRGDELSIGWIISHPDEVTTGELRSYDGVAFASEKLALMHSLKDQPTTIVRQFSLFDSADHVIDAASTELLEQITGDDIVFVGNTRGVRRDFILEMAELMPIKVIGQGWDQYLPMGMVLGDYVANDALPRIYKKAFAVLNDHWRDMADAHILSNRVADVLMSGGLVISDWSDEGATLVSSKLFYRSAAQAARALKAFRANPKARVAAIEGGRSNLLRRFNGEVAAARIFELARTAHARRMAGSSRRRAY